MAQEDIRAVVRSKSMTAKPEYEGVVMMDIGITYPQVEIPGNPSVSAGISGYYCHMARWLFSHAAHGMYMSAVREYRESRKSGFFFRQYGVAADFQVIYNEKGFLSTYRDEYTYTGGDRCITIRFSDGWETASGMRMWLPDVFRSPSYRQVLLGSILTQISNQIASGRDIYFEDYQKNALAYFGERHFYLMPEGIAVYYPLNSIAPMRPSVSTSGTPSDKSQSGC